MTDVVHTAGLRRHLLEFGALARPGGQPASPAAYHEVAKEASKQLLPLMDWLACMGQVQLLRRQLCLQLRHACTCASAS